MKLVFDSKPVIVFANTTPDTSRLSSDRWQIFTIGIDDGFHHFRNEIPDFVPQEEHPIIPPPQIPDLSQNFSLRNYLIQKGLMTGSFSYVYLFIHINMCGLFPLTDMQTPPLKKDHLKKVVMNGAECSE